MENINSIDDNTNLDAFDFDEIINNLDWNNYSPSVDISDQNNQNSNVDSNKSLDTDAYRYCILF